MLISSGLMTFDLPYFSCSLSCGSIPPRLLQATPEKLLQYLVEESVDDVFYKDFLLTYRTFLKDPLPLIEKLKEAWQSGLPDQRERVKIVSSILKVKFTASLVSEDCQDCAELGH